MARKYKTDPDAGVLWGAFGLTLIIIGVLCNVLPLGNGLSFLWFYIGFVLWIVLSLVFLFFCRHKLPRSTFKNIKCKDGHRTGSEGGSYVCADIKLGENSRKMREKLFEDYIKKETERIIKKNNTLDQKDRLAARMIAINNTKHSLEVMSNIWGLTPEIAKEIEEHISVKEDKRTTNHVAYEGRINNKDKNRLKSLLGYECEACGTDMSEIYGYIGQNYIELHHKIPYSDMKDNETRMLTDKEFCVLCPNCHRMIHKLPDAADIDLLARIVKLNKKI